MTREELIDLRKQIQKVVEDGRAFPADVLSAQIVLVFEQAHTPNDDEREALDYAIRCAIPTDLDYRPLWKLIRAIQDAVIAAGFRRTVQGEPTDAQVRAVWDALGAGVTIALEYEELRAALRAAATTQTGAQA